MVLLRSDRSAQLFISWSAPLRGARRMCLKTIVLMRHGVARSNLQAPLRVLDRVQIYPTPVKA